MLAFRILLLVVLAASAIGSIGGNREDQRTMMKLFGLAGALFLLSIIAERMVDGRIVEAAPDTVVFTEPAQQAPLSSR